MSSKQFINQHCVVSIDGKVVSPEAAKLPVFDQAVLLGYGLFETILILDNKPLRLRDHLARLNRSRRALGLKSRFSQSEIAGIIRSAVLKHPAPLKRARVTLTSGAGGFWNPGAGAPGSLVVIVLAHQLSPGPPLRRATLFESATADHWLARFKTTSRAPYMFPAADSPDYNSDNMCLLYSQQHGVTEFTNSAVIVRRGSTVIAPPLERALPGVTRRAALKALEGSADWKVSERVISPADLGEADEIVGLNALAPVFGVNELSLPDGSVKSFTGNELAEYLRGRLLPRRFR